MNDNDDGSTEVWMLFCAVRARQILLSQTLNRKRSCMVQFVLQIIISVCG
jgi:hypothetical protein